METLFVLDKQDYEADMQECVRHCVRGVIIRDGRMAVQKSRDGEYKILGGGMEADEDIAEALAREVQEESGLLLKRGTMREYGEVINRHRDIFRPNLIYVCHTYYYGCEAEEEAVEYFMTASERAKGFKLYWASPEEIIRGNQRFLDQSWTLRDTRFVEWLLEQEK